MEKPFKFHVSYHGDGGLYHAECSELEYDLAFKNREDAYLHAKLAEYEFNLKRQEADRVKKLEAEVEFWKGQYKDATDDAEETQRQLNELRTKALD